MTESWASFHGRGESSLHPALTSREDKFYTTSWAGKPPSSLLCCYTWSISCRSLVGVISVAILASLPCVSNTGDLETSMASHRVPQTILLSVLLLSWSLASCWVVFLRG